MPRGDGTGPAGRGPGTGRGLGRGGGRGRMSGGSGLGAGGECVCPNCGYRTTHKVGSPCYEIKCPKCGVPMKRQETYTVSSKSRGKRKDKVR